MPRAWHSSRRSSRYEGGCAGGGGGTAHLLVARSLLSLVSVEGLPLPRSAPIREVSHPTGVRMGLMPALVMLGQHLTACRARCAR